MSDLIINGSLYEENGKRRFLARVSVHELRDRFMVDRMDLDKMEGYQRDLDLKKVREIVAYLERGGSFYNNILLNIRREDMPDVVVEKDGERATLLIPAEVPLRLYDGQHRMMGSIAFLDKHEKADTYLTLSIALGMSESEEVAEFNVTNTTAKPLSKSLIHRNQQILSRFKVHPLSAEQAKSIKALNVMDWLKRLSPIWEDAIWDANESRAGKVTSALQMEESLYPVVTSFFLREADDEAIARILAAYWQAISTILPEVFEDRKNYFMQKTAGVRGFHKILPTVVEILRMKGREQHLDNPASYLDVLGFLKGFSGPDNHDGVVFGADCWLSGKNAGLNKRYKYSGAGANDLAELLEQHLSVESKAA